MLFLLQAHFLWLFILFVTGSVITVGDSATESNQSMVTHLNLIQINNKWGALIINKDNINLYTILELGEAHVKVRYLKCRCARVGEKEGKLKESTYVTQEHRYLCVG